MNWSDRELETPPAQTKSGTSGGENTFQEKPTKALIGLGVLIVLSLLLYEINHFQSAGVGATPPQSMAQRIAPSSN